MTEENNAVKILDVDPDQTPTVVLQAQTFAIAIPGPGGGKVEFEVRMHATVRDGEVQVTPDIPEETISWIIESAT